MTAKTFSKDTPTEISIFLQKFPPSKFSYTTVSNMSGQIISIESEDNNIQQHAIDLGLSG